ncbi:hypothetical protein BV898_06141 [Hypsibius exemplaris]|nr:hypothetical protein BV898_06141 [Hypsibius exemplaris]
MEMKMFAQVTSREMDRRTASQHSIYIIGFNFVASVVVLTAGVVFSNMGKLSPDNRLFGGIYTTVGVLFCIAGIFLVLGFGTNKELYIKIWFGVVGIIIGFHLFHLGTAIYWLGQNGQLENPDWNAALYYGAIFAFGFSSLLVQGACMGIVARYRSLMVIMQVFEPEADDISKKTSISCVEAGL